MLTVAIKRYTQQHRDLVTFCDMKCIVFSHKIDRDVHLCPALKYYKYELEGIAPAPVAVVFSVMPDSVTLLYYRHGQEGNSLERPLDRSCMAVRELVNGQADELAVAGRTI